MLVIASAEEYIADMLGALRAWRERRTLRSNVLCVAIGRQIGAFHLVGLVHVRLQSMFGKCF